MRAVKRDHHDIDILYHDDHLVAVNKPAGVLVHRTSLDRHETRFALQLARNRLGRQLFPVHRLDRGTSGVLLFACTSDGARRLQESFAAGLVRKTYLAVVRGVADAEGIIDHPLAVWRSGPGDPTTGEEPKLQQAVTWYRRLALAEVPVAVGRYATSRYSLVQLAPVTGRRHQLRRHLKHLNHPVIGDTTHGEGRHNRFFREEFGCSRSLLAAVELSFSHPFSGEETTVCAPLDAAFRGILGRLSWLDILPRRWLDGVAAPLQTCLRG
jgi:tRNA pseudouridine65 synthase